MNRSNYNVDSLKQYIWDIVFEQPRVLADGGVLYKVKNIVVIVYALATAFVIYKILKVLSISSDINYDKQLILRRKKKLFLYVCILVMIHNLEWSSIRGVTFSFNLVSICIILYALYLI